MYTVLCFIVTHLFACLFIFPVKFCAVRREIKFLRLFASSHYTTILIKILRLFIHTHLLCLYEIIENSYRHFCWSGELLDYIVEKGMLREDEARNFHQLVFLLSFVF